MAIHADWGGAHNKEEEERKKRLLGVGASLGAATPKPTVAQPPKKPSTTFDIRETPTSQIRSIVAKQQAKPPAAASPLTQYHKMVITDGADAVTDRIKQCTSIWRRYYEPYDGPSTVWGMVSSSYTVPQLEKLAVYGHGVLFNQNKSNRANYLPDQGGDGTKDGDMLRITTGVRASVGARLPWQETGYRPAVDIMTASANPGYASDPDFQAESAFMTAKEGWADEFSQANPTAVSNIEELTGIKRADFISWRDWLDKVQQWGSSGKMTQEFEVNRAVGAFTTAQDEWNRENHGDELKQHRWVVAATLGQELVTSVGAVMTTGGIGSWAALGMAGKGFTALGVVGYSGTFAGQAGFDPNESAQRLADKQKAEFEGGELKTAAQQRFDDYMATMNHAESVGDREYIKKIQADLQQPIVAEDGSVVRPALGVGLQAEGILDATWRGVIEQAADYNIRSGAELQYQLISGSYATDDMEVTGTFETLDPNTGQWVPDEKWTKALKKAQDDWAGQTKMAEDHPTLYTFLKSFGMPMTEAGWSALGTKMVAEGYAYTPLKALVQASYAVGGVFNSVPAMIENYAAMSKDAKLSQLKEELTAMVKDRMPVADPDTLPFDAASPDDITSAKAQLLVESGIVSDEAAVAKAQEISQRELDLVSQPSYGWVGMFGYLTSGDTEKTRTWLTENYNKVHAFNMAIDLVGQAAIGRVTKLIGAGVGRTPERFLSSNAIKSDLTRVAEMANDGDFGNVASLVGGTDARVFARDLYRYRNQAERFTVSAPITKAKSEFVSEAARAGNRDGVLQSLGEYGKTPAGIAYADRLLTMTGKKQIGSAPATIARAISKRQATTGDIWGTRDVTSYVTERATEMWSGTGRDGHYYNIFPQRVAKDIDSNSYARISQERAIAGIVNDSARKAASAIVLPTYRAPVHSYSVELVDFPNRVADWVGAVTNDMSMVMKWRTKTALTDFSQPRAAARFEAELQSLRPVYIVGATGRQSLAGKVARELVDPRKAESGGESQLTGLKISGPAGEEAQFVGRYKEGGEQRETVMATSQLKHEVFLGRDVMLADRVLPNVDGPVSALGYAFTRATNIVRRFERGMTTIATPSRVVSVGAGAIVLFQKHSFADTGRTLTDIGAAPLAKFGPNRKLYETILAKVSPQVSQRVAFERKVAIETEQHYQLDGGIEVTRQARKTFDDRGRPKNMDGAIDTVRHIVSNKAYEAFVAGHPVERTVETSTPAPETGYEYKPISDPSSTTWYHGTGGRVEDLTGFDLFAHSQGVRSAYGPGLYLTDNPSVARLYAGKVKNRSDAVGSKVFEVNVSASRVLNLEKPAPAKLASDIEKILSDDVLDLAQETGLAALKAGKPLKDVYAAFRKDLEGNDLPLYELDEIMGSLGSLFASRGYAALSHVGGVSSGRSPHNVLILLEPKGELTGTSSLVSSSIKPMPATVSTSKVTEVAVGQEGLEAWVATPEGGKFLTASGQTRKARILLKEMGEKPTVEAIRQTAATNFVNESLELFGDYAQLPYLSKVMREMAAGRSAATPDAIRKAIMNAYKHGENPTVDVPIDTGQSIVTWFAKATKVAMTPNRLNREAVFNHVFEKTYSDLTKKQGVPPDDAAIIASTVARTKTAEVHFDLSYGMRFEMKHRWFAYFGTKHRLWNTWLVQAAVKHPGYAAAINEYANWMQERNEQDDSISEWDKHSLVVDIGKRRFQVNLAAYAWLMDYAIESPFANLIENGVFHSINLAAGTDLKPAPDSFGFSMTRFDPMVSTVWRLIHAPLRDGTEADWKKYIEELPEKEREKFSKDVSTVYGIAKQAGEDISISDACKQVLLGNIAHEAYRFLKPASSKLIDEGHVQLLQDAQEFAQVAGTPESSKWLALHPSYAMTIGAGKKNPYEQAELTSALSVYQSIKERYAQEVVNAFDRGDLEDPEYATWLYNQEQAEVAKLKSTVPIFKSWMDYNGEDTMTFGERAHYAFPSITKEQWEDVSVPPYEEQQLKRQELESAFEEALKPYGFVASQSIAAVKMLRHQYIDIPMAAYLGALPGDLTAAVKNNARILATANKNGFVRSTQYVEMMTNAMKRQMLLSGTRLNAPDDNNLLMGMFSPAEKKYVGVATDDTAEKMWFTYALRRAAIEAVTGAADKGTASTVYKQMTQALDDEVENDWLGKSKTFEEQWAFSKLPLHLRLDFMHFGEGETPEAKGWSDCIEIVSRYHNELANTYNKSTGKLGVGPTSASAAKVVRKYLGQLVSLSVDNKEWFSDWKLLGIGPSKFGFPYHWRFTDGSDYDLWAGDDKVPDEDFIDIYGE